MVYMESMGYADQLGWFGESMGWHIWQSQTGRVWDIAVSIHVNPMRNPTMQTMGQAQRFLLHQLLRWRYTPYISQPLSQTSEPRRESMNLGTPPPFILNENNEKSSSSIYRSNSLNLWQCLDQIPLPCLAAGVVTISHRLARPTRPPSRPVRTSQAEG